MSRHMKSYFEKNFRHLKDTRVEFPRVCDRINYILFTTHSVHT